MLIIGMIFSVSSVCAADLNDTQVIPSDEFIQNDINPDINCNDNSTDNTTEMDFDNIPEGDMDLNNTGVLPVKISYDMEPIMVEDAVNKGIYSYFINFNFVRSPDVKDFALKFDTGEKQRFVKIVDSFNQGGRPFLVVTDHNDSKYYMPAFNKITVTVYYSINGEMESHQMTFEKSDFKNVVI